MGRKKRRGGEIKGEGRRGPGPKYFGLEPPLDFNAFLLENSPLVNVAKCCSVGILK